MNPRFPLAALVVASSWLLHCSGSDTNNFQGYFATVQTTNGLTLGVSLLGPDGTNSTESPIELDFKAPVGARSVLFVPKEEYLARLHLWDASNIPAPTTTLGTNYGRSFGDLYYDIKKFASQPHGPRGPGDSWQVATRLPKLSDLFELPKPGRYRLRLEIQVLLQYLDTRGPQVRQVVRFQPPDVWVVKPEPLRGAK